MAALSCSRHCRHSLPLTFPLYLSVCPLHFICLSLSLSLFLSLSRSVSVYVTDYLSVYSSVCLSVCPSLCLFVCLFVGCLLPTFNLLPSVYLCSLSPFPSAPLLHCALLVFISPLRCARLRSVSLCLRVVVS